MKLIYIYLYYDLVRYFYPKVPMRKHKDLIIFLIITFLRSAFLGMIKLFLRSALKEDSRTLEEIAWYLSLWVMLSYLFGGALAYTFRKKPIIIRSWIIVIAGLLLWFFTDYFPFKYFTIILSIIWFSYGLWVTIKGIITTTEILESWLSETVINAIVNIATILGMLWWSYRWFYAYNQLQEFWFVIIAGFLLLATILTFFLNYDKDFKKHTIISAVTKDIPNIRGSIKRYFWLLIPISILRAISTALWQKMLEIGVDVFKKVPTKWIIIIILSFLGIIIGHIISTFIKKRKIWISMLLTILFWISTFFFPNLLQKNDTFLFINIYSVYLWLLFWIIINILEGKFYHMIWDDHRKEFGSAAYWILNSLFIFLIMILGNYMTKKIGSIATFWTYGIIILSCIFFMRKINKIYSKKEENILN